MPSSASLVELTEQKWVHHHYTVVVLAPRHRLFPATIGAQNQKRVTQAEPMKNAPLSVILAGDRTFEFQIYGKCN